MIMSVSTLTRSLSGATMLPRVVKRAAIVLWLVSRKSCSRARPVIRRRPELRSRGRRSDVPGERRGGGQGAGEIRCVRRPGPGGPRSCGSRSKRSVRPAPSLSAFMARHMEQPGSRQSKPASRKTGPGLLPRPGAFTRPEPGQRSWHGHSGLDPAALGDLAAASRRSSIRPLVQEPMKTLSTLPPR